MSYAGPALSTPRRIIASAGVALVLGLAVIGLAVAEAGPEADPHDSWQRGAPLSLLLYLPATAAWWAVAGGGRPGGPGGLPSASRKTDP